MFDRVLARCVRLAMAMTVAVAAASPAHAQRRTHPDSVRLVTTDIARFWRAVDSANSYDLEMRLREYYLDPASPALRIFAGRNIGSSFDLARAVYQLRPQYERMRSRTLRVDDAAPAIRAMLRRFQAVYPQATFLDVHFVIGRFGIGGWTRGDTMVIAAEMYPDSAMLPRIIAHELVHRQQRADVMGQTLLERSFHEGAADFIGELASGGTINPDAQRYGRAHERELWREFRGAMNDSTYGAWLYAGPVGDRPADLGYFIGYRIAEADYRRARDKQAAIRDILAVTDVRRFLDRSRYSP
jgi:hypothetical protein